MPYNPNVKSYGMPGGSISSYLPPGNINSILLGRMDYGNANSSSTASMYGSRSPLYALGGYGYSAVGIGYSPGYSGGYSTSSSGLSSPYSSSGKKFSSSLLPISEHSSPSSRHRISRPPKYNHTPVTYGGNRIHAPSASNRIAVWNTEDIDVTSPRRPSRDETSTDNTPSASTTTTADSNNLLPGEGGATDAGDRSPELCGTATPGELSRNRNSQQFGTIRRGRTVIRIQTQHLKENPYLSSNSNDDYLKKDKKPKKTAGEKMKEKWAIQSKKKKHSGYRPPSLSDIRAQQEALQKEIQERQAALGLNSSSVSTDEGASSFSKSAEAEENTFFSNPCKIPKRKSTKKYMLVRQCSQENIPLEVATAAPHDPRSPSPAHQSQHPLSRTSSGASQKGHKGRKNSFLGSLESEETNGEIADNEEDEETDFWANDNLKSKRSTMVIRSFFKQPAALSHQFERENSEVESIHEEDEEDEEEVCDLEVANIMDCPPKTKNREEFRPNKKLEALNRDANNTVKKNVKKIKKDTLKAPKLEDTSSTSSNSNHEPPPLPDIATKTVKTNQPKCDDNQSDVREKTMTNELQEKLAKRFAKPQSDHPPAFPVFNSKTQPPLKFTRTNSESPQQVSSPPASIMGTGRGKRFDQKATSASPTSIFTKTQLKKTPADAAKNEASPLTFSTVQTSSKAVISKENGENEEKVEENHVTSPPPTPLKQITKVYKSEDRSPSPAQVKHVTQKSQVRSPSPQQTGKPSLPPVSPDDTIDGASSAPDNTTPSANQKPVKLKKTEPKTLNQMVETTPSKPKTETSVTDSTQNTNSPTTAEPKKPDLKSLAKIFESKSAKPEALQSIKPDSNLKSAPPKPELTKPAWKSDAKSAPSTDAEPAAVKLETKPEISLAPWRKPKTAPSADQTPHSDSPSSPKSPPATTSSASKDAPDSSKPGSPKTKSEVSLPPWRKPKPVPIAPEKAPPSPTSPKSPSTPIESPGSPKPIAPNKPLHDDPLKPSSPKTPNMKIKPAIFNFDNKAKSSSPVPSPILANAKLLQKADSARNLNEPSPGKSSQIGKSPLAGFPKTANLNTAGKFSDSPKESQNTPVSTPPLKIDKAKDAMNQFHESKSPITPQSPVSPGSPSAQLPLDLAQDMAQDSPSSSKEGSPSESKVKENLLKSKSGKKNVFGLQNRVKSKEEKRKSQEEAAPPPTVVGVKTSAVIVSERDEVVAVEEEASPSPDSLDGTSSAGSAVGSPQATVAPSPEAATPLDVLPNPVVQQLRLSSKRSLSERSSSGSLEGDSPSITPKSSERESSTSNSSSSTLSAGTSGSSSRRMPSPPSDESDEDQETIARRICPLKSRPKYRRYEIEDFQFLKVLGKGSFGKVLLAELKGTDCYFAIKCLKKDVVLEDDDVECTMIERKVLLMGSKHPYLCHLLCTFQTESHLFFVMEYLNGGDLMFHIQQTGRFSEDRARFYGAEIVSGLKFLHKKGIIYRDLKLDNILLDFEGHIRIADFGMCKLQIYLDRTADTFCGTPDYMAPEIIKGLKYNQCVDWWAFGILLYEMLIGQSPFSGCDEDELFWSICNEAVRYPRFLSRESKRILEMLLEKDSSKRLGTTGCLHGEVKEQPFFDAINWDRLERREVEPPYKPKLKHSLDVQYFDTTFTREAARLTPVDKEILRSIDQTQFDGFSYTNPHTTD